jgi:hypothetical protein
MNKLNPLFCAVALAIIAPAANAGFDNFVSDSSLDAKFRTIYYNMEGTFDKTLTLPVPAGALGPGTPAMDVDVDYENDMKIDDLGASLWLNWQSGWLFDVLSVELGYQGAAIAWQDGTIDMRDVGNSVGAPNGSFANAPLGGNPAANVQFYQGDADADSVGKLANANIRLRLGDDDNNVQLKVGRYTPSIYDLLHRPDVTYYSMSTIYEGAAVTGDLKRSWGKISPWFNYFTGYSTEHSDETIQFSDLTTTTDSMGKTYDPFDAIYNAGFHTETDYFISSASYSYAKDYLSNGIIEFYSGIPLSMLGLNTNDDEYYIKYMLKYGAEKGLGVANANHSTDVTEFAVGLQAGNLDFLTGVTQIGDESFYGFETQDGRNAGGGTAVWGDMALLNTFKHAGQQTLFLISGYNLDALNLPSLRLQASVLVGSGIDMNALTTAEWAMVSKEDYTETVIDLIYSQNGYQGEGLSVRLTYGQEDNFNAKGFGLWVEYNGDMLKAFD